MSKKKKYEQEINQIRTENKNIMNINNQMKEQYNKTLLNNINRINNENKKLSEEYNLKTKQYLEYNSKKEELDNFEFILFEPDDDNSSKFLIELKSKYTMTCKELICPHCMKGVFYSSKGLEKGSELDSKCRSDIIYKLTILDKHYEMRKKREYFNVLSLVELPIEPQYIDISSFKINEPQYIQLNNEDNIKIPEYESLKNVGQIKKIVCPKMNIFDIPELEYSKILSLLNSIPLIESYKEYLNDPLYENKLINNEFNEINKQISEYNKNKSDLNSYLTLLNNIPPYVDNINDKLKNINENIDKLNRMIEIGKIYLNLNEHQLKIDELKTNQHNYIHFIDKLGQLLQLIIGVSNDSIDDIIGSINLSLEYICNELFTDNPMLVRLSTTKELKNGNEKNIINLEIIYNGLVYDNPEELSGGENKRISLALLLACMKINTSPICILDESLPFLENCLINKCLELIKELTVGKFIIHICHSACDGFHDNVELF